MRIQPKLLPLFSPQNLSNMHKGTHFFGQHVYGQLIKCLSKDKIVEMSRNHGGEKCGNRGTKACREGGCH